MSLVCLAPEGCPAVDMNLGRWYSSRRLDLGKEDVLRSVLIRTSFGSVNSEGLLNRLSVANERRAEEAHGAFLPQRSQRGQRPNTLPEAPTVLNVLVRMCVHQMTEQLIADLSEYLKSL